MALAVSTNGGYTFNTQGYIIIQYNEAALFAAGDCGENTNVGGSGIVVRPDGYMYIWYDDDGQPAVARAAMSDVEAGNPNNWYKYYNGSFSQPGIGGQATPLNQWVGHHTQVTFNTYLNKYISATGEPMGITTSSDGVNWSNPTTIQQGGAGMFWYTNITSPGFKEGTSGQNFDVSYWNVTQPTQSTSDTRVLLHVSIQ